VSAAPSPALPPERGGLLLVAVAAVVLGASDAAGAATGFAIALGTVGVALSLGAVWGPAARPYRFVLLALGVGALTAAAPFTWTDALLAVTAGGGLLLLLVPAELPGGAWAEGSRAIAWPFLGALLVILVAALFAAVSTYVGVAALLWVGVLGLLLFVYADPRRFAIEPDPSPSVAVDEVG
jgi:hypothetical protein